MVVEEAVVTTARTRPASAVAVAMGAGLAEGAHHLVEVAAGLTRVTAGGSQVARRPFAPTAPATTPSYEDLSTIIEIGTETFG